MNCNNNRWISEKLQGARFMTSFLRFDQFFTLTLEPFIEPQISVSKFSSWPTKTFTSSPLFLHSTRISLKYLKIPLFFRANVTSTYLPFAAFVCLSFIQITRHISPVLQTRTHKTYMINYHFSRLQLQPCIIHYHKLK